MSERRAQDNQLAADVRELRGAVDGLGGRVESLDKGVKSANDLWNQQQETDRRSNDAVVAAAEALAEAKRTAENSIPREDVIKKFEDAATISLERLKTIRWQVITAGVVSVLISAALLLIAVLLVNHQSGVQHDDALKSCRERVTISQQAIPQYDRLLASPTIGTDPVLKGFIEVARANSVKAAAIVCK